MLINTLHKESHVWLMNPDNVTDDSKLSWFKSILSTSEAERYRRFRFPDDARRYLLAHALTRTTLSRYADTGPAEWEFSFGKHGRPEISNADFSTLRFNLTHTTGLVGCVVSLENDCGIDIEKLVARQKMSAVAERMFSETEYKTLLDLHGDRYLEYFLSRWTLREAYVKALGIGISFPTRKLHFSVSQNGIVDAEFSPEIEDRSSDWQFNLLQPTKDHIAAVALRRKEGRDKEIVVRFVDIDGKVSTNTSCRVTGN